MSLDKLEKELQIDFFVKILPRAEGNAQLINKRAMGKTTGFMVDLTKTNVLRFTAGAGGNVINTLQPLSENKWYHVTCTYRNKKMQLYLNGELQSEKTLGSEAVLGNDLALSLGKHADDTEPFTGLLDEIFDSGYRGGYHSTPGTGFTAGTGRNEGRAFGKAEYIFFRECQNGRQCGSQIDR